VRHAHEQVDVLDVGVRPLQLFYALKNVYKDNLMDFREYFFCVVCPILLPLFFRDIICHRVAI